MLPTMSGVGRLTQHPSLRFSPSGMAVCELNLAFNDRKRDEAGNWVDGDVFFVRGVAFKQLAENAGECLEKGMEVVVSGRLKTEQWNDKNTGEKRSAVSLLLSSIGPNLAFATAKVDKATRSGDSGGGFRPSSSAPADDPWGAAPAPSGGPNQDDEPPF
jgi:single-strand DNA-binding protein